MKYYINIKCACGARVNEVLNSPKIRECGNCGLDIIPLKKKKDEKNN